MDPFGWQLFGAVGGVDGGGVLTLVPTTLMVAADVVDVVDPAGDASGRLSMAILGLLVLAGLILIATIIYWRMTRPEPGTAETAGMRWVAPTGASTTAAGDQIRPAAPTQLSSETDAVAG